MVPQVHGLIYAERRRRTAADRKLNRGIWGWSLTDCCEIWSFIHRPDTLACMNDYKLPMYRRCVNTHPQWRRPPLVMTCNKCGLLQPPLIMGKYTRSISTRAVCFRVLVIVLNFIVFGKKYILMELFNLLEMCCSSPKIQKTLLWREQSNYFKSLIKIPLVPVPIPD